MTSNRHISGIFILILIGCTAVGYASAGGLSDGTAAVSETSLDTASNTQENATDFPIAGDANGTVPITVEMPAGEVVTITYGELGGNQNVRFDATVRDADEDGMANVTFDPASFGGSTDGFTAGAGTEIADTGSQYADGLADVGLANGTYDVTVSPDETPHYESLTADLRPSRITEDSLANGTYERVELAVSGDFYFPIAGDANGTVPIHVEMPAGETATITYGSLASDQNVRLDATVRDADEDGMANVTFDPTSFEGSTDGFTASEGTEIVSTNGQYADGLSTVGLANGTYDVTVSAGETPHYESEIADQKASRIADEFLDDGAYEAVELTVAENPGLTIVEGSVPSTNITVSESAELSATVRNSGETSEEYTVTLTSDGESVGTKTTTLASGSEGTLVFEHTFESSGTYEIAVDGMQIGEVTVEADDGGNNETNGESSDGNGPGFGVLAAFVALCSAAFVSKYRG